MNKGKGLGSWGWKDKLGDKCLLEVQPRSCLHSKREMSYNRCGFPFQPEEISDYSLPGLQIHLNQPCQGRADILLKRRNMGAFKSVCCANPHLKLRLLENSIVITTDKFCQGPLSDHFPERERFILAIPETTRADILNCPAKNETWIVELHI